MKRSPFQHFKDAALERGLLMFLRPRFERYGEIVEVSINTKRRQISAVVKLRGEETPFEIERASYRTEKRGEDVYIHISDIKVSREWAQHLLEDHFPEISFKIPPMVEKLIG